MKMMSENFSKCPKGLSQNLTIGLNLKFPAKTLLILSTWSALTLWMAHNSKYTL
jgi:hypothetical protein